jgi:hypothetical protein
LRPASLAGEPIVKLPDGMDTISGQSEQSRKLSPADRDEALGALIVGAGAGAADRVSDAMRVRAAAAFGPFGKSRR